MCERVKQRITTGVVFSIVFSGAFGDFEFTSDPAWDIELDVDAAAAELRQAGYEVFRLPEKYDGRLSHPLDDFIEARTEGPDDHKILDAMRHEINAIVCKYGGDCYEWGFSGKKQTANFEARHSKPASRPRAGSREIAVTFLIRTDKKILLNV